MLNIIWLGLMLTSVFFGAINGRIPEVVAAVTASAKMAFELGLGLAGIMIFWLGLMQIAEDSGLIQLFARLIRPIMRRLFPDVPEDHPAVGAMVMNIAANMLGIVNAATPFGLKAMSELDKLNSEKGTATNAMCLFLAINTSSVQLVPATAMAYLVAAGADNPSDVIVTSLIATLCSTVAAIVITKFLQNRRRFQMPQEELA